MPHNISIHNVTSGTTAFIHNNFSYEISPFNNGDAPELFETSVKEEKMVDVQIARVEFNGTSIFITFTATYLMVKLWKH